MKRQTLSRAVYLSIILTLSFSAFAKDKKSKKKQAATGTPVLWLDNWDIKDENNKMLRVRDAESGSDELDFIISDLGATFGKTGGAFSRTRNAPEDYAKAKFIKGVEKGRVKFHYNGKRGDLFKDITLEQAHWLGELLSHLSDQQINDAFRAASYSPAEISLLSQAVKSRISELTTQPQQ